MKAIFVAAFVLLALGVSVNGEAVFTPAKLPCAYNLKGGVLKYEEGQLTETQNMTVHFNGPLFAMETVTNDGRGYGVARYDLAYKLDGQYHVPMFEGEKEGVCKDIDLYRDELDKMVRTAMYYFIKVQKFDGMNRSSYNGKECNMFYREEGGVDARLYASDDNYVIAVTGREGDHHYTIIEAEFNFNAPSMDSFALDQDKYPGCSPSAYSAPDDQCN